MALQRPNNRKLLNKDEEDEKKKQKQSEDYFVLPTFEELQEIERTAKEDAAMTVSSGMRRTLPTDIGRTSANAARQELSDRIDPLMEQKKKAEDTRAEFERMRFAPYSQFAPGLPSAKSVARDKMLEEENKYNRMRMTDAEYERTHKADFGETAEILANSYVAGVAKAGGMAADIAKATGAGIKKAIAGFTDPEAYETSSLYKEFRKGYQQELANGESYYDEFDRYYREMREEQDEKFGKLNTFTNYVEQAAHSGGEMAPIMLLASMGNAMFSGTKLFASLGAKAQSMMASGNKAIKLLGKVLSGVTPGNIASGAGIYITSSAGGTKEAVTEMQNINAQYEAVGLPPKYTDEEIEERAALYGFLTGITEAGGEHAIGGLYGTSTGGITKSIKNPLIKAAASWLIGGIGEGVEESLQTLASYGLKNTVYDAGVSVSWREVMDSGIVGFIMGETTAFPTAVSNTQLGIEAQNAIADALKTAGKVRNDAEAGVEAVNASAQAKAYAAMAAEVRKSDSDNAETVAQIYDWMAERMQQISDAMTDDKKRAEIVARNSGTLDEMNRIADRYGIADGIADTKREKPEDVARMTQSIRDYEQKNGINITDRAGAGAEAAHGARAYSMDANQRGELIDRTGRESGAAEGTISFAHDVSSITGRGIRFYRQAAQNGYIENGYYDPDTDTVYINTASKNPAAQILAHELTHSVEGTDAYLSLRAMVFDLMRRDGVDIDAKYREKEMLYSEAGYRLRDEGEIAHEVIAEYVEQHLLTDEASIRNLAKENRTLGQRIREWLDSVLAKLGNASAKERDYVRRVRDMYAKALGEDVTMDGGNVDREFSVSEIDGSRIDPERYSTGEGDFRYSISHAKEIEGGQSRYLEEHAANRNVSEEELAEAHRVTEAMVDVMMRYSEIMPEDKIGKVLTNNGSYDRSVENTTICVRTLAYNEFVDRVQEQIGRPLTQMESFLVSQKLYDIATEPQCLYCYVSLDRKSYNEMLLRFMQDRDTAIDKYNKSDKMQQTVERLYKEFLGDRKDTKNMRDRYNKWISYADNGTKLLSLADIATEERQRTIQAGGGNLAEQLRDARTYAQSASWSKIQKDYVAYRDEILKLSDRVVKNLNEHYGMRWYSFSDYSAAFIVENMQQITDAAIRGLKGLSYTKDTDFVEIFAPSGMNINISVFVKRDKNGGYYIDERQSADIDRAIALREQYPNVGIVATVTDDDALRWAGEQEWSDVIIPFHIVRTGTDVAEYYKWLNYTAESGDTVGDQSLWDAYVDSLNPKTEAARKKVSKNIYPSEHHNDRETYLNLCQSRGLTPRFARFAGENWYMKLVNETRRTADETKPMKPIFDEDAAKRSFAKFVKKGGYEGGWYREGVDVDAEARAVAQDVLEGKQANEVSYGRQDVDAESLMASRRVNRSHGVKRSVSKADDSTGISDADLMDMIAAQLRGEDVRSDTEMTDDAAEETPVTQDAPVVTSAVDTEVEQLDVGVDTVTDAETEQTVQGLRNDIAADEARYRELTDIVMSDEQFLSLMPDEQNAILDEMQELRARIDEAERIVEDMKRTEEAGETVPVPEDADVPRATSGRPAASSGDGYTVTVPKDFDNPRMTYDSAAVEANPDMYEYELQRKGQKSMEFLREDLTGRRDERKEKYAKRQTVAKAETAFRRLGYDVAGAIVDDYEEAPGIIEDDKFAAQVESDIKKYIEQNDVSPRVDTTAKLIAAGEMEATEKDTGLSGEQLEHAKELASLYEEFNTYKSNTIRAHGAWTTDIVNERLDKILDGYDWFSDKGGKAKRLGSKLQLNLSNPEQVMRDAFGDAKIVRDVDGNVVRTVDPAEALNEYIIRPTIENSARARRQTNQQIAALRDLGLNKSESAMTQIFSEYSDLEESGSRKRVLTEDRLRAVLLGEVGAGEIAIDVTNMEYDAPSKEQEEFRDSVKEAIENEISVNRNRAKQRAYREFKEAGGSKAQWNALTKEARQAKIDEAFRAVTEESVGRIVEATKEMRRLLDDMYEAINAISVIHGAQPIPFRRGYMPHSHRQVAEVQKWFNDHMGGIDVTPVGELPTNIAGKTADRKPNKRWFAHAQERTGPRTEWNALGNVEDYLRVANDTIYHIDDIRKIRILERYIRGIYSVARGATGEDQRKLVRNDVMRRLHKELDDDELVFLGLKKHDKPMINDDDMDLSQMTPLVTWLTHYGNDLAAKQVYNRDTEDLVGRGINNFANKFTSWSNRNMMQYNISSNLKQLSQLGAVSGDVGIRISKDAGEAALKSMRNLGNGSNDLEQRYHISERSTFLAEKTAVEKAAFASDKDLTEKQKSDRQLAKDIWDSAWSFTDLTMSRFAVYSYFMEGMERGMDETAALQYADNKARNILASRMKGSSPLIFQSKNPVLRMFTLFQREPLAAWQDVLKTMPREFDEMKNIQGEGAAKTWIAKRITGRVLGAAMVNTFYSAVLGLGTPAMFDILGAPLSALLEKVIGDLTEDEDDDQTWEETLKGFGANLKNEVADDLPFASLIAAIVNTAAGTDFESRLPINAPDTQKLLATITSPIEIKKLKKQIEEADDADTIEALTADRENLKSQIPFIYLTALLELVGSAVPSGNQIKKSLGGLIATLRGGEYDTKGRLKYEVGGADAVRAVILGKSNTKAAQEWVESGFDSYTKDETEAYRDLIEIGVSPAKAARYVRAVSAAEKIDKTETQAQAEGRILDRIEGLDEEQKAEVYYDMIASDGQREGIDAAVQAGADMADAVETARAIRDASKKLQKLTALTASDMDTGAKEAMYLSMVATEEKDDEGNVIGTTDDDVIRALKGAGLDFDDFLSAKQKQSSLNADKSLSANQRASRFLAWVASEGYTEKQADIIGESFGFASGFRVKSETYQKIVDGGVTPDNAVKVSDALSGAKRSIDKINAIWTTGLTGEQLDRAIKAVLTKSAYEKYRIVIDANVPLDAYTWVLDNADANGNGSINAEERLAALQRLDLPLSELSALWLATGGSEKSNPYADSYDFDMDFSFDFDFGW